MRKQERGEGALAVREVWADLGRREDAGVWLLSAEQVCGVCLCSHTGVRVVQNIEICTDTTQMETNNFDKGLQMISTLEPFPQKKKQHLHTPGSESYVSAQRRAMRMPLLPLFPAGHTHTQIPKMSTHP